MIEFIKHRQLNLKSPVFIYCVGGGMGNVAKLVGYKLIKTFKAKKTTTILVNCFPDVVYSTKKGILKYPKLSLYTFEVNDSDYLILYGDVQPNLQPFDALFRYELSYKIIKTLRKIGVKEVVSLGGYGVEIEPEDPKLYFSANNMRTLRKLKDLFGDEFNIYKQGTVAGMSGLLVALARHFNIPAYLLLSETYPTAGLYGYFGAHKLIAALNTIYKLNVDAQDFIEKGTKLREKVEKQLGKPTAVSKKEENNKGNNIYYFG